MKSYQFTDEYVLGHEVFNLYNNANNVLYGTENS